MRIRFADSDPSLEGKTTLHGEVVDRRQTRTHRRECDLPQNVPDDKRRFLKSLPQGVPLPEGLTAMDAITTTLASMEAAQLTEVLAQMKVTVLAFFIF